MIHKLITTRQYIEVFIILKMKQSIQNLTTNDIYNIYIQIINV